MTTATKQQREDAVRYSEKTECGVTTKTSHCVFRMACRVRDGGALIRCKRNRHHSYPRYN